MIDNIHGERTAFSENWPNNARHWLPMIDHPYDKATGEFIVTAPAQYQVVANGLLIEETDLPGGMRRTHWKQSVPIASWLYALGMARFTVRHYATSKGIPQQVWVFPQDAATRPELFELTGRRAFDFFSEQIGPYCTRSSPTCRPPASAAAPSTPLRSSMAKRAWPPGSAPVVHEVAHQWWGNAVTERDWDDVWLSEGFATYFTLLYTEQFDGRDAFVRGLRSSRDRILQLEKKTPDTPIIHRNLSDMRRVLNQFVYQKGGWTLHMLRYHDRHGRFWNGIREYYRRYQQPERVDRRSARVMERVSGQDLRWFFAQWLTRSGVPALTGDLALRRGRQAGRRRADAVAGRRAVSAAARIRHHASGSPRRAIERGELTGREGRFTFPADAEPADVTLDPNTWLLMETPAFSRQR